MAYQDYKVLMERYAKLATVSVDPGETEESLIKKLMDNSYEKKQISRETNAIIKEYIAKYENDAALLDADAAAVLRDFLMQLIPEDDKKDYVDPSVALRICRLLLGYYQTVQDLERTVQMVCWSMTFDIMVKSHQDANDTSPYSLMAEQYLDDLDGLPDEKRQMLVNCWLLSVYNSKDLLYGLRNYRRMQSAFRKICERMGDDFARVFYVQFQVYVLGFAMAAWHKAEHDSKDAPVYGWTVDDLAREAALIEEIAGEIRAVLDEDRAGKPRIERVITQYYLDQADYYLGKITEAELLARIEALTHPREDYTVVEQCSALFVLNTCYLDYLCKSSLFDRRTAQARTLEVIAHVRANMDDVVAGLSALSPYISVYQINRYLLELIWAASSIVEFDFFKRIVLDTTIYANKELYVHTMMVKEISLVLLDYVLDHDPRYLDGVAGRGWEYWRDHKEEAMTLMENGALLHDIGKYYCLDFVTNSARSLTDDEFEVIKEHPANFSAIYQGVMSPEIECIRDCARLHHLWYNEAGGYPRERHTQNKPFVNILTIADCIDAATDNIGRPYGMGKTLNQLMTEFDDARGTRYCGQISELLHVEEIQDRINHVIGNRRKEIYCDIYFRAQ